MPTNTAAALTVVQNSPLPKGIKAFYTKRIEQQGFTTEIAESLKDLLRLSQLNAFAKTGVTIDENNPEMKNAKAKMEKAIQGATEEYTASLATLSGAAKRLSDDISNNLKTIAKVAAEQAT